MFPIMLNIHGRKCTVAGGGNVAERKVKTLLKYGADVTAVSPVLPPSVTPDALSTNVVVVDVPSTAPAVVAIASARSAPLICGSLPSSSSILALEDTPISVPIVSNISTNRNAKTTTAKSNVNIPSNWSLPKIGARLGIESPLLKSGSKL